MLLVHFVGSDSPSWGASEPGGDGPLSHSGALATRRGLHVWQQHLWTMREKLCGTKGQRERYVRTYVCVGQYKSTRLIRDRFNH